MGTDDQTADPDGIREAARAIRPYLTRLLNPDAAARLDEALADQLTATGADPVATAQLRALLTDSENTAWFLTELLADAPDFRPPYHQPRYMYRHRQTGGWVGPAGDPPSVPEATRYACPHGDYVWHRPEVATPIPDCPTHHVALTRS